MNPESTYGGMRDRANEKYESKKHPEIERELANCRYTGFTRTLEVIPSRLRDQGEGKKEVPDWA